MADLFQVTKWAKSIIRVHVNLRLGGFSMCSEHTTHQLNCPTSGAHDEICSSLERLSFVFNLIS